MIEQDTVERDLTIKPPRNYRAVNLPRLCVNCALLMTDGEITYCMRPNGPVYTTGTYEEWFNVCDNWRKDR